MSKTDAQRPSSKAGSDGKDGDDLSTILNESQRAEVTILVANCTESMRSLLLENFDASAGLDKKLLPEGMTDEEKFMQADIAASSEAYEAERKLKEECQQDIDSQATQKLKKDALQVYDEWREHVLMRIGEAVNTQSTAKEQLEKSSSDPRSPRPKAPNIVGKIVDVPERKPNIKFKDLFPPTKTALTKLPMDRRTLVLHSLLLLLISLEHYNAYSRILMLNLTSSLKLPLKTFEQDEYTTAKGLLESAKELSANDETQKKQEANRDNRKGLVGVATAAGAAILGISGGLAAPLVASGVGSVMGGLGLGATAAAGYLGSVAGSTLLVGGLFGAYGGRMTGQMMDKYARDVEDFEFLPVHSDNKTSEDQEKGAQEASEHDHKLRVTICISGWLTEKQEVTKPWRVLGVGAEVFALKWELEALLNLGHAMDGMVQSAAWGYAQKEIIKRTIFADLMSAFWPLGLVKVARVLDNPFSVAKARADKAGEVLVDALINRAQGERPVTLIGYSLGARVIYTCLKTLAERKAFGLVEHAILIGAPAPSDMTHWRVLRTAVSGRLVNVYSENDYLLGFMYRTSALQYGVAGLQPIRGLAGVENVDVSEDVDGHTRYRFLVGGILKKIGFDDIDQDAIAEEREALEQMLKQEKKNSLQSQRKRLMRRESYNGKPDEEKEAEEEASDMEKQVKDKTQKSMMARVIEWWYTPKAVSGKDTEKAASNLQKAISNPADAKGAAVDAVKDAQASTQSYASYIASKLPSMPAGSMPDGKAADKAPASTSSYMKAAQDYLPSMPSFGGKQQPKKPATASEKATDTAKQAASGAQTGVTDAAGVAKDVVQPTVNNVLNPADNPAVKSTKDAVKKAPIIHQAADRVPGANKAANVASDTVGTTVQNTGQTVSGAVNTSASKATDAGTAGAGKAADAGKGAASTATETASAGLGKLADAGKSLTGQGVPAKATDAPTAGAGKAADAGKDAASTATNAASAGLGQLAGAGKSLTGQGTPAKASDAGKAADAGKDAVSTATDTASAGLGQLAGAGKSLTGQGTPAKETVKSPQQDGGAQQQQSQSYFSRAAGYLPTTPSMPSMPSFGGSGGSGNKRGPPKLGKTTSSGTSTPTKPQQSQRSPSSGAKSTPPKLADRKPSGTVKSPPAKPQRTNSGSTDSAAQKRPMKLDRSPSGVKSPPKLDRAASGLKNEVTNAPSKASQGAGAVGKQASEGAGAATKQASQGAEAVQKQAASWTGAASGAVGSVAGGLPGFGGGKK